MYHTYLSASIAPLTVVPLFCIASQEEEAAAQKQQAEKKAKVEDDRVLELSEDGTFDTSAAPAAKPSYASAAHAGAAKTAPAPSAAPVKAAHEKTATNDEPDATGEPTEIGSVKGTDFPETEEERERRAKEEEEDKTPARKSPYPPQYH